MKFNQLLALILLAGSFLFIISCGPDCKTCTITTVTEVNGIQTTSDQSEAEYCNDTLEEIENDPVQVDSTNVTGIATVTTVTYACE